MTSPEAEALAQELTRQLKHHPRISILLLPKAKIIDDEDQISFYWLDREESGATDTTIRVKDYAGQTPETAAKNIISNLVQGN